MSEQSAGTSLYLKAKIAGVFYLITFLSGGVALIVQGRFGLVAGLIAGACYIAVTLLFYYIFKPVSRVVSLSAAFVSLVGVPLGLLACSSTPCPRSTPWCFSESIA
jgi:hypothetical protein